MKPIFLSFYWLLDHKIRNNISDELVSNILIPLYHDLQKNIEFDLVDQLYFNFAMNIINALNERNI